MHSLHSNAESRGENTELIVEFLLPRTSLQAEDIFFFLSHSQTRRGDVQQKCICVSMLQLANANVQLALEYYSSTIAMLPLATGC